MSLELLEARRKYLKELNGLLAKLNVHRADPKQIQECKAEIALVESYIAKQLSKL